MNKRLDVILVEQGIYVSREKAKQAVESGRVKVDGVVVTKSSTLVAESANLEGLPFEFVSRGGFKLQKAVEVFGIDLNEKVVLDIGASTGGFTDVCLKNGARKVYAVDTGEGQLVEMIKSNPKVINMEKTNFMTISKDELSDVDFVCIDVSFVSLTKLAPKLSEDFVDCSGVVEIVALIKPQFECGLDYARKHKGIVKDEKVHRKIVENVVSCFEKLGFHKKGLVESPIKGGDGNKEFLLWLRNK